MAQTPRPDHLFTDSARDLRMGRVDFGPDGANFESGDELYPKRAYASISASPPQPTPKLQPVSEVDSELAQLVELEGQVNDLITALFSKLTPVIAQQGLSEAGCAGAAPSPASPLGQRLQSIGIGQRLVLQRLTALLDSVVL